MTRSSLSFDGVIETLSVHGRDAPVNSLVATLKNVVGVRGVTSKTSAFGSTISVQFTPGQDFTTVAARVRRAATVWADQYDVAISG